MGTEGIHIPNILVGGDALHRIPHFKAIVIMGKEGKSVAVLEKSTKMWHSRLQITKLSLAAGAPPQTLINGGAYNVLPD